MIISVLQRRSFVACTETATASASETLAQRGGTAWENDALP